MSALIDIFLEPTKAWLQQKERPTFLVPALLVMAAVTIPALLFFLRVDAAWFADYQLQAMGDEMSAAEIEQAKKIMPGPTLMAILAGVGTPVTFVTIYLITAGYYALAGKVAGHDVGFLRALSLATWASVPMALGGIVALVGVLTSSPQTSYESMQLLNVDPLFVQLEPTHPWSLLARSFSLLNFWAWFLAALGWKTWFRTGWGSALFVVMLPSLVIYGVMALFALF